MKKQTIFTIMYWAAVAVWMGVIFSFSMETAAESSDSSGSVLYAIFDLIYPSFDEMSPGEQFLLAEEYSFLIRKAAHFTIFAVLGFLVSNAVGRLTASPKLRGLTSLLIGVIYAISDEIHQAFVPGRACRLLDVMIDSVGVLFGVAASLLLWYLIQNRHRNL